jgi:hypothetical protein
VKEWDRGFHGGVLAALTCCHDNDDYAAWQNIWLNCGCPELLAVARKEGLMERSGIVARNPNGRT